MATPFIMPIPKIGNHPTDCPCATCANARKRLARSPYVQLLQRELIAAHNRLGETATATPDLTTEHEILRLRGELADYEKANRILTNTLDQSRKINQEREKQLTNQSAEIKNRTLSQQAAETRAYNLATEMRILAQAAGVGRHSEENWPKEIKRVLNDLIQRCELYKGQAERTGEANTALQAERDGYAAALKTITRDANTQRLAADGAKAALKLAVERADNLEAENARLMTALKQADTSIEQERRAGWTETRVVGIVAVVLSGLAFFLIGRFGR